MFKKSSKRNLRQRKVSEDDKNHDSKGSEEETDVINVAAIKAQRKEKSQKKKNKNKDNSTAKSGKKSVLSFEGEEEEEADVFQLKKSSRSRRIAKHIKKIAQEERENEGTNRYTKEALEELKALSVKPPEFEPIPITDDFEIDNQQHGFGNATSAGLTDLRPGEIPDANRIHAARKQREMMRKYGSEYIPVETNSQNMRDQDNGSSDEEGPTVEMKGIIDDSIRVANEIGTEGESALNRDNEFDLWEAEIIKKGISTQQFSVRGEETEITTGTDNYNAYRPTEKVNGTNTYYDSGIKTKVAHKVLLNSGEAVKSAISRISNRLSDLKQVNRTRKQDYERATEEIKDSENSAKSMSDLTTISSQYTYYQDMKAYVTDLLDCLTEKNAEITTLEASRHKIWKERSDMVISRRQQDVKDESSDIMQVLTAGKTAAPVQMDPVKQMRTREREARRSRRRSSRQVAGKTKNHIEGMSTDDEETSMDNIRWNTELERIQNTTSNIFGDVVEEFSDVKIILSKFIDWKTKHTDSYNDAYIGLCLPRLLAPFVRLELLHWNPLSPNCGAIEEMQWYKDLLFFGANDKTDEDKSDPDNKLLSGLFDKAVVPKLIFFVGEVWDPLSRSQSHSLAMLLCRLVRLYPCMRAENRRCNELLTALCAKIQFSIDSDAYVPIYPISSLTYVLSGPGAFYERQTWTCIKLFENILLFDGVLSQETLAELAFTLLLNRYIMLSLQMSPITTFLVHKCIRICDAIPSSWLNDVDNRSSQFEPFSRFLLYAAKHINTQLPSCVGADAHRARNCIAQIGKMLSKVGSYEMCQDVAEMLGVKV